MAFKVSEKGKCRVIRVNGRNFFEHKYSDGALNTKSLTADQAFNLVINKKISYKKWKNCPKDFPGMLLEIRK